MPPPAPECSDETAAEKAADATIHALGLAGAGIFVAGLLTRTEPAFTPRQSAAVLVYGVALLSMLSASALYNLTPKRSCRLTTVLRHLDHAMIFVMIAGSYTPFAIGALRPNLGIPLCVTVWSLAAIGVILRLAYGRIYDRISIGLYLGMGWLLLAVLPSLAEAVSGRVLTLLLLGGVVYSLGVLVHTRMHAPFHRAAWHALVVIAAALHLAAVAQLRS